MTEELLIEINSTLSKKIKGRGEIRSVLAKMTHDKGKQQDHVDRIRWKSVAGKDTDWEWPRVF